MRLTLLFSILILAILAAMPAAAQAPDAIQVAVPFAFTVHSVSLPAGDYRISRAQDGSGLVTLQNVDSRQTVLFLATQTGRGIPAEQSSVAFKAEGAAYSLADVWWAGYAYGARMQAQHEVVLTAGMQESALLR